MNKGKILGILLIGGASILAMGGSFHLNLQKQSNKVLLVQTQNVVTNNDKKENINNDNTKYLNSNKNTDLSKKEVKELQHKTIEVGNMKFKGLRTVSLGVSMPQNSFAVAPGFNQNGFASSTNKALYEYELSPANDSSAMKEATYLHGGNPVDTCVYFQSSALRAIGVQVPYYIGYTTKLEGWLKDNGWTRHTDFQYLQRGDIVFAGVYHTFCFMGWKDKAKGIAYVMGVRLVAR